MMQYCSILIVSSALAFQNCSRAKQHTHRHSPQSSCCSASKGILVELKCVKKASMNPPFDAVTSKERKTHHNSISKKFASPAASKRRSGVEKALQPPVFATTTVQKAGSSAMIAASNILVAKRCRKSVVASSVCSSNTVSFRVHTVAKRVKDITMMLRQNDNQNFDKETTTVIMIL